MAVALANVHTQTHTHIQGAMYNTAHQNVSMDESMQEKPSSCLQYTMHQCGWVGVDDHYPTVYQVE